MNNIAKEKTDRIIELLGEILKWTKFQGWQSLKNVLLSTLNDDISKLVYHCSDGSSSREIAELTPISHVTVVNYWRKWAKIGIVEPIKVPGGGVGYRKMFSLEAFGIEVPEVKETQEAEVNE